AEAITRILGEAPLRTCLEDNCYQWGRKMTWHNVAIEYLDAFHRVMPSRRAAA
ncbi:MAG: glycosyltransferase family 4 protein, partial [Armatimonadetes bacterium]|nr:glycosyltransferase family 4 protein [Armatimonadota bacterium]